MFSRIFFLLCAGSIVAQECLPTNSPETLQEPISKTDGAVQSKVAVVEILNGMSLKKTIKKLIEIEEDDTIAGVIVTIDHTGGSVSSFCVIHDMIKEIALKKPVVGLLVGQAFSCGYLMASATDYLIAHSMSEIGSIGIVYEITRYREARLNDKDIQAHLDKEMISAGRFKLAQHPFGPELSEETRQYVMENIQKLYNHFITTIAHNRNINVEQSSEWAEGKVFVSSQALQLGLIDEIGTIFSAKRKIQELIQSRNKSNTPAGIVLQFDKE